MFERTARPPVLGLIFLAAVAGSVGWAATADTDPVIDREAPPIVDAAPSAGAAQTRAAELRRTAALR